MKKSTLIACLLVTAAGFGGVAALVVPSSFAMSGRPSHDSAVSTDRYKCFDTDEVRNYISVNQDKMVIVSDRNQAYELTLTPACIGIDTSFMVGIKSRTGMPEICDAFDADILYSDDMDHRHLQHCPVTGVRHLTGDEAASYINGDHSKRQAQTRSNP